MGDVDVIVGHQDRNKIVDYIEEAEKSEKNCKCSQGYNVNT